MLTRIDRAAPEPQLSFRHTRDGRMEVYDRGRRTKYQITPRYGGRWIGNHYGLAPPIAAGSPSYPRPRDALDALAVYLAANPGDAR